MAIAAAGLPFGGPLELALIVAVIVLLFGVGKISGIGADLGRGIREFRKNLKDDDETPAASAETAGDASFCNDCGARNKRGAKFCGECGHDIGAVAAS
jgi:sec-independent protein translocase protein TatA